MVSDTGASQFVVSSSGHCSKRCFPPARLRLNSGNVNLDENQLSLSTSSGGKFLPPFFWMRLFALGFSLAGLGLTFPSYASGLEDWARMKSITPSGYVCYRAGAMNIDGRLDEAAWQAAPWTEYFVDIEGDAKPKPRYRTRAKMLWDDEYLYIAADLEEPHVWATLTQHDAVIFHDNDFEVFIDPDGDSHEYYEFEINALNTGWDLRLRKPYKDGGPALNEWEIPGLRTAVHVNGTLNNPADTDVGWTVEMAFPWKVLTEFARRKTPPAEGDQWRINFSRVQWLTDIVDGKYVKQAGKKENNWVWSPQGIIDMHRPEKWGCVQFTSKKVGAVAFVPDPALAARNQLHEIYYAQRDYQKKNGRWAKSLEELSLGKVTPANNVPVVRTTPDGFEASVDLKLANGKTRRWHVRHDALVWSD